MKHFTIPIEKRRTARRLGDVLHLINKGNKKIYDTFETLGPTFTSEELSEVYELHKRIMDCQVEAYRILVSEKEEINGER